MDDSYTASVRGSYHYEVQICKADEEIHLSCTCPYDWGGICKHCIAVGLHILNYGNEVVKKTKTSKKLKTEDKFEILEILNKATSKQKEQFLKSILQENRKYKEKSFAAILPQTELESKIKIDSVRDKIIDILENFDLENYQRFYDGYDRRYGFRDEWDIIFDGAEEELENSMKDVTSEIERNISNGNLIDASKILLGLYEGISLADCSEINDPACIFEGEFNNQIDSYFLDFFGSFISSFSSETLNSEAAKRIIDIVFDRIKKYAINKNFSYDMFLFRDFLKAVIIDKKSATKMLSCLKNMKLLNSSTNTVQLSIYLILEDRNKWLVIAEKYYKENTEIAQDLLDFYKNSNREKFIYTAKILLESLSIMQKNKPYFTSIFLMNKKNSKQY